MTHIIVKMAVMGEGIEEEEVGGIRMEEGSRETEAAVEVTEAGTAVALIIGAASVEEEAVTTGEEDLTPNNASTVVALVVETMAEKIRATSEEEVRKANSKRGLWIEGGHRWGWEEEDHR